MKKVKYDAKRALAVKAAAEKFGVSEAMVRMVINADRLNERILKFYRDKYSELSKVMSNV